MQNAKGDDIKKSSNFQTIDFSLLHPSHYDSEAKFKANINTHTKWITKKQAIGKKKNKVVIFLLNERINKMVFAYATLGNGTKMALEYCLLSFFRRKFFYGWESLWWTFFFK